MMARIDQKPFPVSLHLDKKFVGGYWQLHSVGWALAALFEQGILPYIHTKQYVNGKKIELFSRCGIFKISVNSSRKYANSS
jgi:hypothetical protein